ncbi:MAG: CDP-diacylglycerol--serine O-phosphatidyltransferase [Flammeovirgaceae bacterium]|nr:MAG: CDP-diacylglycerol--serine O-phosphatidyltransferase [Flammeovirgaceae bacterium]
MKRFIPNILTIGNLLCGCIGIVYLLENKPMPAAYFVWVACVFDFLDGFTARLLKTHSAIGKELDSLADVVSFGVLPSLVIYKLWPADVPGWIALSSLSIVAFSALRLAIFNIDETQTDSFRGLPTPANAILLTSLPLLPEPTLALLQQPIQLMVITILSSWLLISPIGLFAIKFKSFSWKGNEIRFTFLLAAVLLLSLFKLVAVPLVILLYIAFSLLAKLILKQN